MLVIVRVPGTPRCSGHTVPVSEQISLHERPLVASSHRSSLSPRFPPLSLHAGGLVRSRGCAGAEHAAGNVPWLGLPRAHCPLHVLCMENFALTLHVCLCCSMLMLMLCCLAAAAGGLGVCVLVRVCGVGGARCMCVRARDLWDQGARHEPVSTPHGHVRESYTSAICS